MIIATASQLIITRKMSGTGSIHDMASDQYDRTIQLRKLTKYVVILPAYYNAPATRHNTLAGAIRQAKKDTAARYSPTIVDRAGKAYSLAYGELVAN